MRPAERMRSLESGHVHSMILWGPPGCGKTTLALLLARYADAEFVAISAVLSGLPQVREVLAEAAASLRRRPPHGAVRGRGAPLQQGAAGCVPAAHRARQHPVRRRDHRESLVRTEFGVAVALPRARAGSGVDR
jgi:energy-coupling factor transporter ATP-binding protein EcfA2